MKELPKNKMATVILACTVCDTRTAPELANLELVELDGSDGTSIVQGVYQTAEARVCRACGNVGKPQAYRADNRSLYYLRGRDVTPKADRVATTMRIDADLYARGKTEAARRSQFTTLADIINESLRAHLDQIDAEQADWPPMEDVTTPANITRPCDGVTITTDSPEIEIVAINANVHEQDQAIYNCLKCGDQHMSVVWR